MTYIIVIVCIGMLVSIYYIFADVTDKVFIVITVKLCDIGRRTTASVLIVMGRFACMPFACMLMFGHDVSASITDIVTIFIIMRYSSVIVGTSARIVFKMPRCAC